MKKAQSAFQIQKVFQVRFRVLGSEIQSFVSGCRTEDLPPYHDSHWWKSAEKSLSCKWRLRDLSFDINEFHDFNCDVFHWSIPNFSHKKLHDTAFECFHDNVGSECIHDKNFVSLTLKTLDILTYNTVFNRHQKICYKNPMNKGINGPKLYC